MKRIKVSPDIVGNVSRSTLQRAGEPLRLSSSDDGRRAFCLSGNGPGLLLYQHHPHLSHHRRDYR